MKFLYFLIVLFLFVEQAIAIDQLSNRLQDEIISKYPDQSENYFLSIEQMKNDLDQLIMILTEGYGGNGFLPENQDQILILKLHQLKNRIQIMRATDFCNELGKLIEEVSDYHLSVMYLNKYCQRKWPVGNVGIQHGMNRGNSSWFLGDISKDQYKFPIIVVKKMTNINSDEWGNFFDQLQDILSQNKDIIIDLRGNSGGDIRVGNKMARLLYGLSENDVLPFPTKIIHRSNSTHSWIYLANSFMFDILKYSKNNQKPPDYLVKSRDEMIDFSIKAGLPDSPQKYSYELGSQYQVNKSLFKNKVYILIDRECGSSCELFIELLEQHPNVITIGENTAGCLQFGNLGKAILFQSGIIVNVPTQATEYKDGRFIEKIGYAPKIKVPAGTDALDFLFQSI